MRSGSNLVSVCAGLVLGSLGLSCLHKAVVFVREKVSTTPLAAYY